jgi:hypothetical protein
MDQIISLIGRMEGEAKEIRNDVIKMCWYMRGGVTYTEGMNMSHQERDIINNVIKENLETTKKSGLPFF